MTESHCIGSVNSNGNHQNSGIGQQSTVRLSDEFLGFVVLSQNAEFMFEDFDNPPRISGRDAGVWNGLLGHHRAWNSFFTKNVGVGGNVEVVHREFGEPAGAEWTRFCFRCRLPAIDRSLFRLANKLLARY